MNETNSCDALSASGITSMCRLRLTSKRKRKAADIISICSVADSSLRLSLRRSGCCLDATENTVPEQERMLYVRIVAIGGK